MGLAGCGAIPLRQQGKVIKGEVERNKARDALLDGQLRELQRREVSRIRDQAEAIEIVWSDGDALPGESLVTVINFSRRPILLATCWVYPDDGVRSVINGHGEEMLPAPSIGGVYAYTMPERLEVNSRSMLTLRGGGRAGFRVPAAKADCTLGSGVRVRFTDDAKRQWGLWDDQSLSEVENSTPSSEALGLDLEDDAEVPSAEAVPR